MMMPGGLPAEVPTRGHRHAVERLRAAFPVPAALLVLAGCGGDTTSGAGPTDPAGIMADQVVYGVRQNMSTEGIRDAILDADSMFMWQDSTHVHIMGLRLTVFDEMGARRATIEAREGRLNEASTELTARGDVVLTIVEGDREIRSEELKFAPETDRIWTDSAVVMRTGNCIVRGTRLQADMSFEDVRVWGTSGEECASP